MKVTELAVKRLCDFGSEKHQAQTSCPICAKDLCEEHAYVVGVKTRVEHLPEFLLCQEPTDNLPRFFIRQAPVCPECARLPLLKIMGILLSKGNQREF